MAEPLAYLRVFYRFLPFAFVGVDQELHAVFQLFANAEAVFYQHGFQVRHSAFQFIQPGSGTRQRIGRFDIKHKKAVNQPDAAFLVEVGGQ
ncbi:hypothetical protein D9M70_590330 [compost metagenome]